MLRFGRKTSKNIATFEITVERIVALARGQRWKEMVRGKRADTMFLACLHNLMEFHWTLWMGAHLLRDALYGFIWNREDGHAAIKVMWAKRDYEAIKDTTIIHAGRHLDQILRVSLGDRFSLIPWARLWNGSREQTQTCPCCWLNCRHEKYVSVGLHGTNTNNGALRNSFGLPRV